MHQVKKLGYIWRPLENPCNGMAKRERVLGLWGGNRLFRSLVIYSSGCTCRPRLGLWLGLHRKFLNLPNYDDSRCYTIDSTSSNCPWRGHTVHCTSTFCTTRRREFLGNFRGMNPSQIIFSFLILNALVLGEIGFGPDAKGRQEGFL
jgi:hypothetical protein